MTQDLPFWNQGHSELQDKGEEEESAKEIEEMQPVR